jgi:hypothetical protein
MFFIKKLGITLQKICYPSICVHCYKLCNDKSSIFCAECFYLINLLDQEERCSYCFTCLLEGDCLSCTQNPRTRQLYVSEKEGPIDALLQKILLGQHYRVPAAAALMTYQYLRLNKPLPDYVVPTSRKKLSVLLAKEISKILHVPYCRIFLKKHSHILLAGFQMDRDYNTSMEKLQKVYPKTLMGLTLVGLESRF